MAEPSFRSSRQLSQPSVMTNLSIRSASTQRSHPIRSPQLYGPRPVPTHNPSSRQPVRSYYATNPDPPNAEDEVEDYMNINAADADGYTMNFNNSPQGIKERLPKRKDDKKKFIGGFVNSLRKVPRSMFKPGRNSPVATKQPVQRAPFPSYMLTPPTPVVPGQQTSYVEEHIPFPQPEIEPPDILSHSTSPHPTRIEVEEQSPEQNPDRDPDAAPSRHTSQHNPNNTSTNHNSYGYPSSYRNPPSIAAHPQPSPDYRRMSRHTGEESIPANSYTGTPSFSTELERTPFRIIRALLNMPWISHDRVTVDYSPGMESNGGIMRVIPEGARTSGSRGSKRATARWSIVDQGWRPWKRTSVFLTLDGRVVSPQADGPSALARGDARKGQMYVPVDKPLTSWYSGGHIARNLKNRRSTIARNSRNSREVDLLSLGSSPRSSVGTARAAARRRTSRSTFTSPSPTSPSPARRPRNRESAQHTPQRHSRRLYYSNDEYVFLDPGSTPGSSPIIARRANPRSPRSPSREAPSRPNVRRRNRDPSQSPQVFMPPPASSYPLSPLVFLPPSHLDSAAGGSEPHPHSQSSPVPAVFGVTPVYMSMLPPPPPPGSASGIGESSPPGLAGRGAGGGYGSGYGVQGYGNAGGTYAYGYAYPYRYQSPPPQVHHYDEAKRPTQPTG
ncbi:hypothetical protein BDP27DRAFT_1400678 [Rhodocollybia butyracea]|uniref:Uncharacterized protein n=1 Tax=Rhodocollybia butyracea TaxID=206335 RepID=A0A9P5Q0X4_9AGAR|nr:hypothetical protein BDP27DRAFT_1400678 [Rhodocollybia butyracea]